jgi:Zn-finger protein
MLKWAMAGVIALSSGSAYAQVTGKTVLNANTNLWAPTGPYTAETSAMTGTFHAGGVAACDGCHVMHNASHGSARSTAVAPWTDAVPAFLLQGSDQSSTCLMCHGDPLTGAGLPGLVATGRPYVITHTGAPDLAQMNYTPGGDFGWLSQSPLAGGHNVAALDFAMAGTAAIAPGGTFTADAAGIRAFACSNCHDPHGRARMELTASGATTWQWTNGPTITQPIWSSGSYGNLPKNDAAVGAYRLLGGAGYFPASNPSGAFAFPNNPPVAIAPANYNHAEGGVAANETRVAYGKGMSEWCQNCHTNIHLDNYTSGAMGGTGLKHPAGQGAILKPGQYNVYNSYVSSGVYNGTNVNGEGYTSLVPFENSARITNLVSELTTLATAATTGSSTTIFVANGQSNVMCLSCHRAHASAFGSMVRWNMDDTFITNSDTVNFVDTQARTNPGLVAGYYGRTPADFGVYQRSMCNKCHGKD